MRFIFLLRNTVIAKCRIDKAIFSRISWNITDAIGATIVFVEHTTTGNRFIE